MRLIVTRPLAQAMDWVDALRRQGCDAQALPLIAIAAPTDTAAVRDAWSDLAGCSLVMFVSANAVQHFFAQRPADARWPDAARAGSTGPGTSQALRLAGVPPAAIVEPPAEAGRFDSEALWACLQQEDWNGRRARIVRGEEGRDWLADTLKARGASVDFVAAYRRQQPQLDAAGRALLAQAQAAPAGHLWVFSSSEAVANLQQLAPAADWSRSAAVASHPRIAATAQAAGFAAVQLVAPTVAALVLAQAALGADSPSIQSKA
jgi:uroporphyrinogen-III synthase